MEFIELRCSKENIKKRVFNVYINSTSNAIVLAILLMFDQIHDFCEKGRNKEEKKNLTKEQKGDLATQIKHSVRNYIDTATLPSSKVDLDKTTSIPKNTEECVWKNNTPESFNDYMEIKKEAINPKKSQFKKRQGIRQWFKTIFVDNIKEDKYKTSLSLLETLGIRMVSFDELEKEFSDNNEYFYPKAGCRELNNIFNEYLLYSGFHQSKDEGVSRKLRLYIDAHGSRFNISPLLYNLCDFVFGDDLHFSDVKIMTTIATMYDSAGTQGAELFVNKLADIKETRLFQYLEIMNDLNNNAIKAREFYESKEKLNFDKNDYDDYDDIAKKIDEEAIKETKKEIKEAKKDRNKLIKKRDEVERAFKDLKKRDIGTKEIHDIREDEEIYKKTYNVYYASLENPIIQYSLTIVNNKISFQLSDDSEKMYEDLLTFTPKQRELLYIDIIEKLIKKNKTKKEKTPEKKESIKFLNKKGIELPAVKTFFKNPTEEFMKEKEWKKFVKSKKIPIKGYYNYDEDSNRVDEEKSQGQTKTNREIFEELVKEFNEKVAPKVTNKFNENVNKLKEFLRKISNKLEGIEISRGQKVIVPLIVTWMGLDKEKLKKARNYLCYGKEENVNEKEFSEDFIKNGMSEPYIESVLRKRLDEKNFNTENCLYYLPYKTIGDFSQIQECFHKTYLYDALKLGKKYDPGINVFVTFDRIAGYISSLFNRTILEQKDKETERFIDINTFIYSENEKTRKKYVENRKKNKTTTLSTYNNKTLEEKVTYMSPIPSSRTGTLMLSTQGTTYSQQTRTSSPQKNKHDISLQKEKEKNTDDEIDDDEIDDDEIDDEGNDTTVLNNGDSIVVISSNQDQDQYTERSTKREREYDDDLLSPPPSPGSSKKSKNVFGKKKSRRKRST